MARHLGCGRIKSQQVVERLGGLRLTTPHERVRTAQADSNGHANGTLRGHGRTSAPAASGAAADGAVGRSESNRIRSIGCCAAKATAAGTGPPAAGPADRVRAAQQRATSTIHSRTGAHRKHVSEGYSEY